MEINLDDDWIVLNPPKTNKNTTDTDTKNIDKDTDKLLMDTDCQHGCLMDLCGFGTRSIWFNCENSEDLPGPLRLLELNNKYLPDNEYTSYNQITNALIKAMVQIEKEIPNLVFKSKIVWGNKGNYQIRFPMVYKTYISKIYDKSEFYDNDKKAYDYVWIIKKNIADFLTNIKIECPCNHFEYIKMNLGKFSIKIPGSFINIYYTIHGNNNNHITDIPFFFSGNVGNEFFTSPLPFISLQYTSDLKIKVKLNHKHKHNIRLYANLGYLDPTPRRKLAMNKYQLPIYTFHCEQFNLNKQQQINQIRLNKPYLFTHIYLESDTEDWLDINNTLIELRLQKKTRFIYPIKLINHLMLTNGWNISNTKMKAIKLEGSPINLRRYDYATLLIHNIKKNCNITLIFTNLNIAHIQHGQIKKLFSFN